MKTYQVILKGYQAKVCIVCCESGRLVNVKDFVLNTLKYHGKSIIKKFHEDVEGLEVGSYEFFRVA